MWPEEKGLGRFKEVSSDGSQEAGLCCGMITMSKRTAILYIVSGECSTFKWNYNGAREDRDEDEQHKELTANSQKTLCLKSYIPFSERGTVQ